jgi:charged multivesicular body protein 6
MGPCYATKNKNSKTNEVKRRENGLSKNEKVLLECKQCRDNIKLYIKKLERTSNVKREKAKELLKNKQKDRAKLYLKQSKFHLEQVKISEAQLTMIEEQINNIESTTQMLEIQKVLEKGNNVLKEMQKEMNVEKWEKIKDDMDELQEEQNEINQFFREHDIDVQQADDEVNEMFNKMEKELGLNEEKLPEVPQGKIVIDDNKEKVEEKKEAIEA